MCSFGHPKQLVFKAEKGRKSQFKTLNIAKTAKEEKRSNHTNTPTQSQKHAHAT